MQFPAAYIMRGRMQAVTVASVLVLLSLVLPPLNFVSCIASSATIALVTLRLGARQGLYVLLTALPLVAAFSLLVVNDYQPILVYGLEWWLPVWLIAIVLRESRQMVLAVEIAVLLGIMAVIGVYVFQPEPAQMWRTLLHEMAQLIRQTQPDVPEDVIMESADTISHYMTGVRAAGSVFELLLSLFLARIWQANLYNPGGFKQEYLKLQGHKLMAIATVIILAVALPTNLEVCWNILVVLIVFYTFTGSAVWHYLISPLQGSRYWLAGFYLVLFFIPQFMAMVSLCGLVDTWLNLRSKIRPN
ncbi:MAG: DUF2232 domain-containing protein [Methylomonas sp.]|jgi:hypothetical protein